MVIREITGMPRQESAMEQPPTVSELVRRARDGDREAWDGMVDRFLPMVTGVIGSFRLSAADADDVNGAVWLRLVEHLDDLREPRALPGWLATTARRESLRIIGARSRSMPADPAWSLLDQPAPEDPPDEAILARQRAHALRDALWELSPHRRELLLLLLEDPPVPYDEIARRLGIPVGSIGPTRARALEQLRRSEALRPFRTTDDEGGAQDAALG